MSSRAVVDEVFAAAVEGAQRIVDLIATVPEAKRALAWSAAKQSYLQTARTLGYDEHDAQQWASAIISLLEIASVAGERGNSAGASDLWCDNRLHQAQTGAST
jgi:hypothetical protein